VKAWGISQNLCAGLRQIPFFRKALNSNVIGANPSKIYLCRIDFSIICAKMQLYDNSAGSEIGHNAHDLDKCMVLTN